MDPIGTRRRKYRPRLSTETEAKLNARLPSHHNKESFVNDVLLNALDGYATMNTKENKKPSKETTKRKEQPNRQQPFDLPQPLEDYKDLIHEYWGVKAGSKSKRAWALLIGSKGLGGIQTEFGEGVLVDQLERAIANKWKSIMLDNCIHFGHKRKPTNGLDFDAMDQAKKLF